jgi:large subunit ribosomal protein L4
MIKYQVYNQQAQKVGEETLSDKVFGLKPNAALLHQVVVGSMANVRQVLAHTKGRAEVRGGASSGRGRKTGGNSKLHGCTSRVHFSCEMILRIDPER